MLRRQFSADASGSCLCGAVRFWLHAPRGVVNCHCGRCRKFHGNYAAYTQTAKSHMRIAGEGNLIWYPPQGKGRARRGACKICGSSLFWEIVGGDSICVSAGALDAPSRLHTIKNIYVHDAGDYYAIDGATEMYAGTMKNAAPVNGRATAKHVLMELTGVEASYETAERGLLKLSEFVKGDILHSYFHRFPRGAVAGIAVLSESQVSIHTWPEKKYAAVDIFMRGMFDAQGAEKLLDVLFRPGKITTREILRGMFPCGNHRHE